jgi:hypothetical protein
MNHAELVELALSSPKFEQVDFDTINSLSSTVLRSLLKPAKIERMKPELINSTFVEVDGKLKRRELWTMYKSNNEPFEFERFIPCAYQVKWNGRTVSASIVLHWVRTGELVKRTPRANLKPFRAVVRVGATVKHLGYFATEAERAGAIFMHQLQNSH